MKARIRYLKSAIYDRKEAIEIINRYFASKEEVNLGMSNVEKFRAEFLHKEELLRNSPKLYRIRTDYPFNEFKEEIRSFIVHWFTVFYYYDGEFVNILYIRSSRSDFSVIPFPQKD